MAILRLRIATYSFSRILKKIFKKIEDTYLFDSKAKFAYLSYIATWTS